MSTLAVGWVFAVCCFSPHGDDGLDARTTQFISGRDARATQVVPAANSRAVVQDSQPAVGADEGAVAADTSAAVDFDAITQRVVKVHGGALGREQGYAAGIIVSADGQIVTALSTVLESPVLRVVLADGRRFAARVVRRDDRRQLALLQIDAQSLPWFEFADATALRSGDWVVAAGNPFKVAAGPEPVSVLLGVFAGRARLEARRRTQDFPYEGEVLLLDMVVATPGFAGGALVDLEGRLLGMIGKAVESTRTNTWLNYAMPAEEIAAFLAGPVEEPSVAADSAESVDWGIRLFDVGGQVRLAYVERVRPASAARRAGVRVGDLILAVGDVAVASCVDYYAACERLPAGEPANVLVKRGDQVLDLTLEWEARPQ